MHVLTFSQLRRSNTWDQLAGLPFWLTRDWLGVLAKAGAPPTRYLAFYRKDCLVGVCLLQTLPVKGMKLGENVRPNLASIVFGGVLEQFGQVLYSANGGMHFLPQEQPGDLIDLARRALAKTSASCCYLMKDIAHETELEGWQRLQALPEMVMPLRSEWSTFEDYLISLPSKYRKRAKRARKKFEGLTTRLFSVSEVASFRENIDALYNDLMQRAPYVPYRTPEGYVLKLKEAAPDRVEVRGYFDDAKLVGFSTLLFGDTDAIAHYSAITPRYNASHQLYLNLLLDLLQAGIARGAEKLHYGRTATTIKSSVGAEPFASASFASHDGCIRHQLLTVLNTKVLADAEEELIQRPLG